MDAQREVVLLRAILGRWECVLEVGNTYVCVDAFCSTIANFSLRGFRRFSCHNELSFTSSCFRNVPELIDHTSYRTTCTFWRTGLTTLSHEQCKCSKIPVQVAISSKHI